MSSQQQSVVVQDIGRKVHAVAHLLVLQRPHDVLAGQQARHGDAAAEESVGRDDQVRFDVIHAVQRFHERRPHHVPGEFGRHERRTERFGRPFGQSPRLLRHIGFELRDHADAVLHDGTVRVEGRREAGAWKT